MELQFTKVHCNIATCIIYVNNVGSPMLFMTYPANIYLFKLNNRNTRKSIIIIFFFKVDLYKTIYNYKKPINVNLPRKLEKNSDLKRLANSLI